MGSIIGAAGSLVSGFAQQNEQNYQAAVAQNNATIEEQNANYAEQAGGVQAFNEGLKNRGIAGRLKANQAAAGVDVNTGSAKDVQVSQRETGLQDVSTITSNANRQAYGYRAQATGYQAQAGLDSAEASEAPIAGAFSAAGQLAGGSGQSGNSPTFVWNQLTGDGGSGGGAAGGGSGGNYNDLLDQLNGS